MDVSVSDAKGQLTDLVKWAEAGEEVVLTRHGKPAVRLVPVKPRLTAAEKMEILLQFQKEASAKILPGPDAARSQDFLYDEDGLPG